LEGPRVGWMPNRGQSPSSFSALKPLKSVPSGQSRHVSPAVVAAFYSSTNTGNISHTAQPISANLSPDTNPPPADHRSNHPEDPWDASPPTLEIMGIIWSPPTFATGCHFSVPQTSRLNLSGEGNRIMEGTEWVKHGRSNNGTIASSSHCPVQLRNPDITYGLSDDS